MCIKNQAVKFFFQDDKVWEWDRIFTEVASDLRTEWEKAKVISDNKD